MIKTKACQRLIKEVKYYEKEVQENEAKLAQMKQDGKDPYDIKKFQEVLGESHMMIPNSQKRMKDALEDLLQYCGQFDKQHESEWYGQAKELLDAQSMQLEDGAIESTDVSDLKDGEAF